MENRGKGGGPEGVGLVRYERAYIGNVVQMERRLDSGIWGCSIWEI